MRPATRRSRSIDSEVLSSCPRRGPMSADDRSPSSRAARPPHPATVVRAARFASRPAGDYAEVYWERLQAMALDPGGLAWDDLSLRFSAFQPGVSACVVGTASLDTCVTTPASWREGRSPRSRRRRCAARSGSTIGAGSARADAAPSHRSGCSMRARWPARPSSVIEPCSARQRSPSRSHRR
jgi:hypothetical protein